MTQKLDQMTTTELKHYISDHRNDSEKFRSALQVLLNRRDPNLPYQPYPFDLDHPEREVEAILKEKFKQASSAD